MCNCTLQCKTQSSRSQVSRPAMHLQVARIFCIVREWHSPRHTRRSIEEMLFSWSFSFVDRAQSSPVNRCQNANPFSSERQGHLYGREDAQSAVFMRDSPAVIGN